MPVIGRMKFPVVFGLALLTLNFGARADEPALIPRPVSVKEPATPGVFRPDRIAYFAPDALAGQVEKAAREEWGVAVVSRVTDAAKANLVFEGSPAPGTFMPGYTLTVDANRVRIYGPALDDRRHGLQTLRSLARREASGVGFAYVEIKDAPRFRYRGLMLDSARHIQSVPGIKRLLDQMALLKLNVFHWHLTDNNGWRVEIPSYPRLARVGGFLSKSPESERNGYYTTAQLREVAAYARERGIEIIPEIDVPGHSSALVEAYPEFLCPTNKRPAASTWTNNRSPNHVVCVANEKLLPFLVTVFKETASALGAKRVHIGGDEVEEGVWSKCPHCSAAMKKAGMKHEYELESAFLTRLSGLLQKQGLQTVNWLERPDKSIAKVDMTVAWRGGGTGAGHVEKAVAAGVPVINAKGDYAYFDYPQFGGTAKSGWMPTLPLERVYNFTVMPEAVAKSKPELLLGGECTLWTEEVLERDIDAMLFPRVLAFAEQMWTPDVRRDFADFQKRLAVVRPELEKRGVRFAKPVERDAIVATPGASVVCSLKHAAAKYPEYALDGNDVTSFMSAEKAKSGDTFTVNFAAPASARKVTVITGSYYLWDEPDGRVKSAVLEASPDGVSGWAKLADFKAGFAVAAIPSGTRSLRLRLTGDQAARLVVSEFRLE